MITVVRKLYLKQSFAQLFPGYVQCLGKDAGLGGDGHEVGVSAPAREGVQVDVVGDTSSGGLAKVHAEVEAVGAVDLAEAVLHALGEQDHLLRGLGRQGGKRVDVQVGQDEDVAGGVGVGVEADEAAFSAMEDVGGLLGGLLRHALGDGVVGGGDHVAEDAVLVFGGGPPCEGGRDAGAGLFVGAGDVVIAPRGPETIHRASIRLGAMIIDCLVVPENFLSRNMSSKRYKPCRLCG
jgi:hypothetical protein